MTPSQPKVQNPSAQVQEWDSLLQPGSGEQLEAAVENGLHTTAEAARKTARWVSYNPGKAALSFLGAVGLWTFVQFGVPWMINKYHESKAQQDIAAAEEQVFTLAKEQGTAFRGIEENRFIIRDEVEGRLEKTLAQAGEKAGDFKETIAAAKEDFSQGKFRDIRATFESNYDDAHQGMGVIERIASEVPPVTGVSAYVRTLREKRDKALQQEAHLAREMALQETGYEEHGLRTVPGKRLRDAEPVLRYVLDIAIRSGVKSKAQGMYGAARGVFVTAYTDFSQQGFVHYTPALDNTFEQETYDAVLGAQEAVFAKIRSGDGSLAELRVYKGKLQEQWFTVVVRRWEDSHQQEYYVTVDNPAYREWTDQVCHQECETRYCNDVACRSRANSDGSIDEECVTVREECGQDCHNECHPEHRDNGQPEHVQEKRYRRIPEFWVAVDKHTLAGTTQQKTDLEQEHLWRQTLYQNGFQRWKPFGDDREYEGFGSIGPNGELPLLVRGK